MTTYRNNLYTLLHQRLRIRLTRIPRNSPDFPFFPYFGVREDSADDGAALISCAAEDGYEFCHGGRFEHLEIVKWV